MMVWVCIAVRIIANPFSNVFQKLLTLRAAHPLFIICITHGLLSLACAPLFLYVPIPQSHVFWTNISIGSILAVAGNVLIVQALKLSDLSLIGPINAWKPVGSLFPGMLLLREFPGWLGLCGIVLIVAGSYLIVDNDHDQPIRNFRTRFFMDKGIQCRFAALILSAVEAVFLKKALVGSSPPMAFAVWSLLGFVVSLVAVAAVISLKSFATTFAKARSVPPVGSLGHEIGVLRTNRTTYLMLFATTGLMQLCTIVTLEQLQVGYALALFQTSALVSVILGHRFFNERHFFQRLVGASVMVVGAILIIVGG